MSNEFNSETKQIIKDIHEKYKLADFVKSKVDDYRAEMNLIERGSIRVTLDEFRQLKKDLRYTIERQNAISSEISCLERELKESDSLFDYPLFLYRDSIEKYYEEINN